MPKILDHEERRTLIARGAAEAISKYGIHKVTMIKLAEEVGCTEGMVNYYFDNKEHVLQAALEQVIESTKDRLEHAKQANPRDLEGWLLQTLPLNETVQKEFCVWRDFWQRTRDSQALQQTQARWIRDWVIGISGFIEEARIAGELRQDLDVQIESEMLATYLDGLGLKASLAPDDWPAKRQKQHVTAYLTRLY
ncbi:MAG: TetR/AcrR family transcriptional regulator [Candidatus Pelagadaptatus aseana]|uniref:TetR/AcrR family transcriptional regulator n=1 Tax=Candidatus Pelagadaptatus aseana TaxID=3120508 RepID=UPI0039B313DC